MTDSLILQDGSEVGQRLGDRQMSRLLCAMNGPRDIILFRGHDWPHPLIVTLKHSAVYPVPRSLLSIAHVIHALL